MALGTPVVASDTPIFREVGGDAVSYVDPESPEEFATAVTALDDRGLWEQRSRRSVERAAEFNWDESARQLLAAAEEAAALRRNKRHSPQPKGDQ
jgi:glycosyltransferase involved in cell wall biosynthesis